MTDGLSLPSDTSFNSAAMRKLASSTPSDEKFQFLLFVLDSLERRKLAVDPAFYSSILAVGAQGGGLQKRVASLFARSRNHGHGKGATTRSSADSTDDDTPPASHRVVGGPVRELFRLQGRAQCQRRVPRGSRDDVQEELRSSAGRGTSGGVSRKATGQRAVKQGDCTARECRLARLL